MTTTEMPSVIQSIGLACVPQHDIPSVEPALMRKPVAAAVLTLRTRHDGHRDVTASYVSDARDTEFPLSWLIDQALIAHAPAIITPADRATLATDAMTRRFWIEPNLAALCTGARTVDPCALPGAVIEDEVALCRRLQIPRPIASDADVQNIWNRHRPEAAIDVALGIAVARLMLWAHQAAFTSSQPDAFFETLLPLRDWCFDEEKGWPSLQAVPRSRPVARASSFASTYHAYCSARDRDDASWVQFEDGLFHT